MDSESFSCLGLIAIVSIEHALNEFLLEFPQGVIVQNAFFDHLLDEGFQLISHGALPLVEFLNHVLTLFSRRPALPE